jgi:3-hydroxyisobutyrate dehydrogenase-like beta-hydroxyacid dehydrogenase
VKIGFVGVGTMGLPIAKHLLAAGHTVQAYDVVPQALRPLLEAGAVAANSLAALAGGNEVICLSLPGPEEITEVVAGAQGVRAGAKPGLIVVDLSTNSVACARELAARCADAGVTFVDAPVSGGAVGAERGTLSVMVGAEPETFARVQPVLETFAREVFHVGSVGAGALAKLVNNQIFLCVSVIIQEGFVMGAKAGMDSNALMNILGASSAGLYTRKADFLLTRDFANAIFKLSIAHKDVDIALQSAEALGVNMPTTRAALAVYRQAVDSGFGDEVFSATLKVLEAQADTQVAELVEASDRAG